MLRGKMTPFMSSQPAPASAGNTPFFDFSVARRPQAVNDAVLTPAFILGVTGNTDPAGYVHWPPTFSFDGTHLKIPQQPAIQAIIDAVTATLDWLLHTSPKYLPSGRLDPLSKRYLDFESPPPDSSQAYHSCWKPLGLGETPIVVLSSLAPGIDTLVVETVFAYLSAHPKARITVRAPLPFPEEIYARASSFEDDERRRNPCNIPDAPKRRLEHVLRLIKSQTGYCAERDIFEVPLHHNVHGNAAASATEITIAVSDLTAEDPQTRKKRRNLRYRAAGEYVAAYSDILLACYDEIHDQLKPSSLLDLYSPGTVTIVEAKRSGLTDGLLPIPNIIAWADTGPVLHLPIDRLKHLDNKETNTPAAQDRPMRLLQPYDNRPEAAHICSHDPDLSPRWQENGHRLLTAGIRNLAAYSKLLPTAGSAEGRRESLRNLFTVKDTIRPPTASIDAAVQTALACESFPFGAYAALRDATSAVNGAWGGKAHRLHVTMFRISIATVLLFVLSTTNLSEVMSMGEAVSGSIRRAAFLLASGLFFYALLLHKGYSLRVIFGLSSDDDDPPPPEIEDRQFDYRAIAEGMRVQAYWSVSGLFASVASRYIQRLRGELGWIRCVISSTTFPYHRTRDWFAKLEPRQRIEILEAVQHGWIQGQIAYFTGSIKKDTLRHESWTAIGRALLTGAFVLATYALYVSVCDGATLHALVPFSTLCTYVALFLLVVPFGLWFAEYLARTGPGFEDPDKKIRKETGWHFWKIFFPTLWQEHWTCTQGKAEARVRHLHLICALVFGASSAMLLAFLPLSLAGDSATKYTADVTGGLKSALLGLSGLVFVWMERRLLSENIRRYSAMLGLFTGANTRLGNKLTALRALPAATTDSESPEQKKLLLECQDLLLALGQEALTENAEWIVMRRSRRIKPVPPSL